LGGGKKLEGECRRGERVGRSNGEGDGIGGEGNRNVKGVQGRVWNRTG